ncbi:MAG: 3-oxoacyl-[acyl-carrier protein] reductase, partial [Baekduia sp.]|nr:3-oxoacyl-[acyl-carrier protein] reductase [Baekduia sp.]
MSQAADTYQRLSSTPPGRFLVGRLGLPESTPLRRHEAGQPLVDGFALLGGAGRGRLLSSVDAVLAAAGAEGRREPAEGAERYAAVVFDASAIATSDDLGALRDFFSP